MLHPVSFFPACQIKDLSVRSRSLNSLTASQRRLTTVTAKAHRFRLHPVDVFSWRLTVFELRSESAKALFRSVSRSPWRITLSLHPTEIPLSWILLHSDKHFASTVVFAQFVFATACLRPANVFLSTVTVRFQQPDLHSGSRAKSALLEFPSGSLSLNFAPKVLKHFFAPSAVRLGGLRYRFILRKFRCLGFCFTQTNISLPLSFSLNLSSLPRAFALSGLRTPQNPQKKAAFKDGY